MLYFCSPTGNQTWQERSGKSPVDSVDDMQKTKDMANTLDQIFFENLVFVNNRYVVIFSQI